MPSFRAKRRRFAALSQARVEFLGITTITDQLIPRKEAIFLALNMAAGQTVPETIMTISRIFPALACAALLTACAGPAATTAGPRMASMDSVLSEADAAAKAGRPDQAYAMLKAAAASNPADKTPLLRIAQMRFDDKQYGEAIVSGQQALERDPNDMLAYSLVAVSGLRVSSKALADLSQKNGFTGSVRTEAQDLAAFLRTTLGGPIVAPAPARPATVRQPSTTPAAPKTPATTASTVKPPCSGPFCGLN